MRDVTDEMMVASARDKFQVSRSEFQVSSSMFQVKNQRLEHPPSGFKLEISVQNS
jgi:hypothetical protein